MSHVSGSWPSQYCQKKSFPVHRKRIQCVAWNCDGTRLASGSLDHTVRTWLVSSSSNSTPQELTGHKGTVEQICWHPQHSDIFCSASNDKTVRVWDARAASSIRSIETKGQNLNLAWSPDGSQVAVGNKENNVSFIDTKRWTVSLNWNFGKKVEVNEMAWDPSGTFFLMATGKGGLGYLDVFRFDGLVRQCSVLGHDARMQTLKLDPTGKYCATGAPDGFVCLWDIEEMVCVRTFGHLEMTHRSLSFSNDGEFLACAGEDHKIAISDVKTGNLLHFIECKASPMAVAWNPKKRLLAYAGDETMPDPDHSRTRGKELHCVSVFGYG